MSKFALLVAKDEVHEAIVQHDVVEENASSPQATGACGRGSPANARSSIKKMKKKYADVEALLQAVYQNKSGSSE